MQSTSRHALPADLKDTTGLDFLYEDLVSRPSMAKPNIWKAVLPWLAISKQPLSPSELRYALLATKAAGYSDINDADLEDLESTMVTMSRGLCVVRHRNGGPVFELCHWTAADFFKRSEMAAELEWPSAITRACLRYISMPASETEPQEQNEQYEQYEQRVASHPFYEYAFRYWAAHLKDVADPVAQSLHDEALKFLSNPSYVASSAQALLRTSRAQVGRCHAAAAAAEMDPLSLASYLDLATIASALLPEDKAGSSLKMSQTHLFRRTSLLWAACGGSLSVARLLLKGGYCAVDQLYGGGDTALSLASSLGHGGVVVELLKAGASLEASDTSPLILAAEGGHSDIVRMLLDHGANPGLCLSDGETAIHRAAANGHAEGLKILLDTGADAKVVDRNGQTPLMRAVSNQHWSVVQVLLASSLDLGNYRPKELLAKAIESEAWELINLLARRADARLPVAMQSRLLCQAAWNGKESVVGTLVQNYPDAAEMSDGDPKLTPLAWAARGGHLRVIRVFVQHGINVNLKNGEDKTALVRAIEAGQDEAAEALLDVEGLDTSYKDPNSTTLLASASRQGMTRTVRRLLELGHDDPYAVDASGHTALSLASEQGHVETARVLLTRVQLPQQISLPCHSTPSGLSLNPLILAIQRRRMPIVELLAQQFGFASLVKATGNNSNGQTALSLATELAWPRMVEILLAAPGVHPDIFDIDDKTPLCWATEMRHESILELLIELQANVNVRTMTGWTPLHYAVAAGNSRMIRTLLPGADPNIGPGHGTTPLVLALQRDQGNHLQDTKYIIDLLLPYDHVSLHLQVMLYNVDMVRRLLDIGYDVNTRDLSMRTPLHTLAGIWSSNQRAMANVLLTAQPEPDLGVADEDGLTPLRLALQVGHLDLAELFLASPACPTHNVTLNDWLDAYDKSESHYYDNSSIVKVQKAAGQGTKVVLLSPQDFYQDLRKEFTPSPSVLRRI